MHYCPFEETFLHCVYINSPHKASQTLTNSHKLSKRSLREVIIWSRICHYTYPEAQKIGITNLHS